MEVCLEAPQDSLMRHYQQAVTPLFLSSCLSPLIFPRPRSHLWLRLCWLARNRPSPFSMCWLHHLSFLHLFLFSRIPASLPSVHSSTTLLSLTVAITFPLAFPTHPPFIHLFPNLFLPVSPLSFVFFSQLTPYINPFILPPSVPTSYSSFLHTSLCLCSFTPL